MATPNPHRKTATGPAQWPRSDNAGISLLSRLNQLRVQVKLTFRVLDRHAGAAHLASSPLDRATRGWRDEDRNRGARVEGIQGVDAYHGFWAQGAREIPEAGKVSFRRRKMSWRGCARTASGRWRWASSTRISRRGTDPGGNAQPNRTHDEEHQRGETCDRGDGPPGAECIGVWSGAIALWTTRRE